MSRYFVGKANSKLLFVFRYVSGKRVDGYSFFDGRGVWFPVQEQPAELDKGLLAALEFLKGSRGEEWFCLQL